MDMVFNVTFNNISVILVEERGVPTEKYLRLTNLVPYLEEEEEEEEEERLVARH
jgi:hypothetical protein